MNSVYFGHINFDFAISSYELKVVEKKHLDISENIA